MSIHATPMAPGAEADAHAALTGQKVHGASQQHPIRLYLWVWGWLFVLSACSYLVDYFGLQGMLRWSLILLFMVVKAGLIVAVFMHMAWERLALVYAILVPPGAVLLFVAIMAFESDYTHSTRITYFGREAGSGHTEMLESAVSGSKTGNPAISPGQLKKEAEESGPGASKPGAEAEGRQVATSGGSAAAIEEAGRAAPAGRTTARAVTGQNEVAATSNTAEWKLYTLKPGDTLWKIAEAVYGRGHGAEYRRIFEANKQLLSDPSRIRPGRVLRIPPPPA
ncbi:MAG: cytochrome C oxidase subunit IV family protein [Methylocapsa sp.]|nr:cytochrome C oxidase subunit IV family protein [Methylocapsa sp.]